MSRFKQEKEKEFFMPKKKNFSRLIPNVFIPFFLSFDFCCYEITTEIIYIKLYYLQK